MKRLIYLLMGALLTSATITSCLSDDKEDNTLPPLTQAEKAARLQQMSGIYSGQLYFINDTTERADSVPARWEVVAADSSLNTVGIPAKVFANGIRHADSRAVLEDCETAVRIPSNIIFYRSNSEEKSELYSYWLIPRDMKTEFVIAGSEGTPSHTVSLEFAQQVTQANPYGYYTYYAIGEYKARTLLCYYIVKSVKVDGYENEVNRVIYLYGKSY